MPRYTEPYGWERCYKEWRLEPTKLCMNSASTVE